MVTVVARIFQRASCVTHENLSPLYNNSRRPGEKPRAYPLFKLPNDLAKKQFFFVITNNLVFEVNIFALTPQPAVRAKTFYQPTIYLSVIDIN